MILQMDWQKHTNLLIESVFTFMWIKSKSYSPLATESTRKKKKQDVLNKHCATQSVAAVGKLQMTMAAMKAKPISLWPSSSWKIANYLKKTWLETTWKAQTAIMKKRCNKYEFGRHGYGIVNSFNL